MRQPGYVALVCIKSDAAKVRSLGDTVQMPFINRMSGVTLRYDKIQLIVSPNEFLNTSHRVAIDVAVRINRFY